MKAILEPKYEVVGMIHDGGLVVDEVRRLKPDLVCLDLSLPNRMGLDICRDIVRVAGSTRVLVVSMQAEKIYADEAFRAGAAGFMNKLSSDEELLTAVEAVLAGQPYRNPKFETRSRPPRDESLKSATSRLQDPLDILSRRQRQVFALMGHGKTTQEIAEALGVETKTVEFHRAKLEKALGIKNVRALQALSMERMSQPGAPTLEEITNLA
jgi:DNA-binding NarL/FixJ family response regulator